MPGYDTTQTNNDLAIVWLSGDAPTGAQRSELYRAGDEVVQLYARAPQGDGRPLKELRGFQRVHLQPGEARDVVFTLDPGKDLRHYDEQAQAYAVVPGEYELQVGASSADIRARTRLAVEQY